MNRTSLRRSVLALVVSVLSLAVASGAVRAQEREAGVRTGASDVSLTIRGILSATLFLQDARFGLGNGQQANFVQQELEGWWHGGDVRNMRLTFDFQGPQVMSSWRVNATFEADLFGGFNGAGAFGDEQPVPRLRLAYADLTNGSTTLRVGQNWSLTWGNIPTSTSHIGFPWGWGSGGLLGWRFPGIFFLQALTPTTAATKAQLQLAVLKGSWVDEAAADQPSAGEAGTPQLEARLNLDGRVGAGTWGAYVVGHWDRKDLNNVRAQGAPEPAENNLDSWAVEAGGRVASGALTVLGNAYTGKAMGHHFGQIIQFGDIKGWGAWAQAGFNLTQQWSLWLFYGTENPDDDDLAASSTTAQPNDRTNSWLLVPMLRYKLGPYSLGLEWLYDNTEYRVAGGTVDRKGNQLSLSARYDF
jgi:hypothetical protein